MLKLEGESAATDYMWLHIVCILLHSVINLLTSLNIVVNKQSFSRLCDHVIYEMGSWRHMKECQRNEKRYSEYTVVKTL